MKKGLHPKYSYSKVVCACGNIIETRTTRPNMKLDICSGCHPFFTGTEKLVDTEGRIERFRNKYKNVKKK